MHRACLALGSNVGDRRKILDDAVDSLNQAPGICVVRVSSYYETPPIGGPDGQGAFLNAAAVVETTLGPLHLLAALQTVEAQAGRVRDVRWDARTLDIDLLLFDDLILDLPEATIPHPRMHVRRFVLGPLAEIAADGVDPLTGQTVAGLLANLDRKPNFLCVRGLPREVIGKVARELRAFGSLQSNESTTGCVDWGLRECEEWMLAAISRYRQTNWSTSTWGDRWMISDSWPGTTARQIWGVLGEAERQAWKRRFEKGRDAFVRPTFIAASPYDYCELRCWADLYRGELLGGGEIPIICPGFNDPVGFVRENPERGSERKVTDDKMIDRMTHEILASCAAVRPESLGRPVAPPRGLA